jgi:hypothetical protein
MDERIERVLTVCDKMEQGEVTVLYNAMVGNMADYQTDKSAGKLKDWRDAKKALGETVDALWQKYFDQDEPFKSRTEVVAHLQGQGYKVKKSKLYQDAAAGRLKVQPDGTVRAADVREYIAVSGLKQVEDKTGKMLDDQAQKLRNENRSLVLKCERQEFELKQLRGEFIRRTDVESETAIKIAALDSGLNNAVRVHAPEWVGISDQDELIRAICAVIYDLLDAFGNMEELRVVIKKAGHEARAAV